jgi:hypothetical protein
MKGKMDSIMDKRSPNMSSGARLSCIQSLQDLTELVGALTPEEEAMLAKLNWSSELTDDELQELGPEFTQHLISQPSLGTTSDVRTENAIAMGQAWSMLEVLAAVESQEQGPHAVPTPLGQQKKKLTEMLAAAVMHKLTLLGLADRELFLP